MSTEARRELGPFYFLPINGWRENPRRCVIVGAGTGSDVAIALDAGASHVAVEIDPKLYEFGVERHPDDPYGDPRVDVFITDGREFLDTDRRYDTILFALPDSLTLEQQPVALRLESYLFTREAFEAARSRLNPAACSRCTTTTGNAGSWIASPGPSATCSERHHAWTYTARKTSAPSPRWS